MSVVQVTFRLMFQTTFEVRASNQRTLRTSSHLTHNIHFRRKSYCSTVHFCRITSIYQPTNAHIISHRTLLKHFKALRHVSILSDHHQGALFLAKFILQYSQFNSYLQTRCCGSISVNNYTIKYTVKTAMRVNA